MWWISLLTLYQLQVNNYYSCFIVTESIPGYCHLARDKRLGCELLFCIWSNVIHFMICCNNNNKCKVSGGVKDRADAFWDRRLFMGKIKHPFFLDQMSLAINSRPVIKSMTMSILSHRKTHTTLRPHPAPPRASFIVYSEPSVAPTLSPCGPDQSVVIMPIWAVSHWEKREGVKSVCLCVCVWWYVVGLHLSECDYSVRSLWNSLCINNYACPLGHGVKGLSQTRLWKRGLSRMLLRCVAEENMLYNTSIQMLFSRYFLSEMICLRNQIQQDCFCFLLF